MSLLTEFAVGTLVEIHGGAYDGVIGRVHWVISNENIARPGFVIEVLVPKLNGRGYVVGTHEYPISVNTVFQITEKFMRRCSQQKYEQRLLAYELVR